MFNPCEVLAAQRHSGQRFCPAGNCHPQEPVGSTGEPAIMGSYRELSGFPLLADLLGDSIPGVGEGTYFSKIINYLGFY